MKTLTDRRITLSMGEKVRNKRGEALKVNREGALNSCLKQKILLGQLVIQMLK
ncbi:hypothetical protein J32TS6_07890 [Virgibacillus pantothenticus]|nr:hypothetical protein J32TS6_07890 [Virgibacillus pantothenticus]